MKRLKIRRTTTVFLSLAVGIFVLANCTDGGNKATEKPSAAAVERRITFESYAGLASCAACHADVYKSHLATEHHLTSMNASAETILGRFADGENRFAFDALNEVRIEKEEDRFYQVHYQNGELVRKEKMDLVVGSGRKGQSFLNWNGNTLSQLPITFFTPAKQWSNSPGYPPSAVAFNRPITSRCLECHSTFFETIGPTNARRETFDRSKTVLGVECEKCHGPGAEHVRFQTENPAATEAKFIVNPGKLSRQQVMDFCSLCHGGRLAKTKPSFQFQAGDTLTNYFSVPMVPPNESAIDVHGNQTGLLSMSKCYQVSGMTCLSCHNVHRAEKDQLAVFSQRCASCHNKAHGKECKMTETIGGAITQNCIDCHMPKQASHAVAVYLQNATSPTPALMRTHVIKIYPEETKKFLHDWKGRKK